MLVSKRNAVNLMSKETSQEEESVCDLCSKLDIASNGVGEHKAIDCTEMKEQTSIRRHSER